MKRWAFHGGGSPGGAMPWWTAVAALALVPLAVAAASFGVSLQRIGVLLVLAPLVEEVIFRAGLHESLLRRGQPAWRAIVLTALAFGAAHALLRGDAAAFAVALAAVPIGMAYQRWRRVWPCVALHAAMNALWLAWGLAS